QSRRGSRQHKHRAPARAQALKLAARSAIESLITSVGDQAAENCLARWREHPAGAALLDRLASSGTAAASWQSEFAAEAGLIFGGDLAEGGAMPGGAGGPQDRVAAPGRASPGPGAPTAPGVRAAPGPGTP